ncbi:hypothetical protein PV08_04553 [Exophiala spinifera]|uniref:NmrA-like domain-containing protein n=1 Tax=Exophiala spinifera TaxID=91928 RepID=A0A0D2BFH6_9EURO|nr:uncharacterized protein PV08_04553 [Exophiala spinifera]KIW17360.1 hypothetical protein PV08_04553 [Exophiala spinifera]
MTFFKPTERIRVVVFGGTGSQGLSVVKALASSEKYVTTVLTRDNKSKNATEIATLYGVKLVQGSYTTEEGLRAAFNEQDVAYVNFDSFGIGEPAEYFWTFRAYEIAIQSGLKLFIYPGAPDRYAQHNFVEDYRNSHNIVAARLSNWLTNQPTERLPWTILTGGVYASMLNSILRPIKDDDGVTFAVPMAEDSVIPLIPLENYGLRIKWILENAEEAVGKFVSAAPYHVTFPEIAKAFEKVNGIKASFRPITVEQWIEGASAFIDVDKTLPRGSTSEDPTTFTFRKSFSAWWRLWRDSVEDQERNKEARRWISAYHPSSPKNIEEWMTVTRYGSQLL